MVKKILILFAFLAVSFTSNAQVFTQTFVDRCTGEVQVVTANFQTGSAVVSFYNKVRVFTYQEYTNGTLQAWLIQTYAWWNALSPCSQAQQQATQAQQTAQQAQQSAQQASQSAQNTTNTTNTTAGTTSGGTTSGGTSGGDSGGSSSSSGGTTEETKTETKTEETKTEETKTEETKTEETKEESKTEESKEESSEEESSEESSEEDSEENSEEDGEEKKEEEKEEEKEKKQKKLMPIQLKADMLTMQTLTLKYNAVLNIGASQSSIFGDVSYGANLMVWDNLRQASLSLSKSKVSMNESYEVTWIDSYSASYMRSYNMNATTFSMSRMRPMGKWGTVGVGINYSYMFGKDTYGEKMADIYSLGYNFLYTNSFKIGDRITYSPAIIGAQNPISYMQQLNNMESVTNTSTDFLGILSNSFTIQLTRRFSFNTGWTLIYSSNEFVPLMNSFMIGAKLPF